MDTKQLQRFKNEAQAAAHLQHTNIVPVHYVGCERGVHFYAMQYIEGQTLAAVIRDLRQLARPEAPAGEPHAGPAASLASELASGRWAPGKRQSGKDWSAFDASLGVRNAYSLYGNTDESLCVRLLPENYRPNDNSKCDTHHFWSAHPGGGNWLFADGRGP